MKVSKKAAVKEVFSSVFFIKDIKYYGFKIHQFKVSLISNNLIFVYLIS